MRSASISFLTLVIGLVSGPARAQECQQEGGPVATLLEEIREAGLPVPREIQRETVDEIIRRVRATPNGVVVMDINYTADDPRKRTREAMKELGKKTRFDIPEFRHPGRLPLLPRYRDPAFARFLLATGLAARYPAVDWPTLQLELKKLIRHKRYMQVHPTPGLVDFVHKVQAAGGHVVFNTGVEAEYEVEMRAALKAVDLGEVPLFLKPEGFTGTTPEAKASHQPEIEAIGPIVAVVDDRAENRESVAGGSEDIMQVALVLPGYAGELSPSELEQVRWRMSSFER